MGWGMAGAELLWAGTANGLGWVTLGGNMEWVGGLGWVTFERETPEE